MECEHSTQAVPARDYRELEGDGNCEGIAEVGYMTTDIMTIFYRYLLPGGRIEI